MLYSKAMKPVTLPPGRAKLSTKPAPTGSPTIGNTIGTVRVASSKLRTLEAPWARMTSGCELDQFGRVFANSVGIASGPTDVNPHVVTDGPIQ